MVKAHGPRFKSCHWLNTLIYPVLVVPGADQHPEVRVPMESPKGLAMKGSSVFKKQKKGSNWLIQYVSKKKLVKEVLDISAIIKHC